MTTVKKQFQSSRLVDVWRTLYPKVRDYTHFSAPHDTYSRIDHLFTSHALLNWSQAAWIGSRIWTDHSPVFLSLVIPDTSKRTPTWRLNENLLCDPVVIADITETIKTFMSVHDTDFIPFPVKWEMLKCVLRGTLIKHGARLKKANSQSITNLLSEIQVLERAH